MTIAARRNDAPSRICAYMRMYVCARVHIGARARREIIQTRITERADSYRVLVISI